MIDLELYRIFYVVALTGNITKASEQLHISQPAVTKQIKNLEVQLKTPLFIRTKKGVVLNECGEKIFLNVKKALTLLDEVEKDINSYNETLTGTIKIGISTTLMRKYLLKYLEEFHKMYPKLIVDIYTDPTKELITKLKNGKIDLIIGKFPQHRDKELEYNLLGKTKYIFASNKNFINQNITLKNIKNFPILLQEYPSHSRESALDFFKRNNLDINPTMNIASSNLLIDFTKLGYGIGYLTEMYIEDDLKNKNLFDLKLTGKEEEISFGIISLSNNIYSKPVNKFIDFIKKK